MCSSGAFTTKRAHTCTKTPPQSSPPLYRLPGQQEWNLPRGMLRMEEREGEEQKKEEEERIEIKGETRYKRQPNLPGLILIQLLEGGCYRVNPCF